MSAFDAFAKRVSLERPALAVVLGSGLAGVTAGFEPLASVAYGDVPGLVAPGVPGHAGRLTLDRASGRAVLVFHGRFHFYEGHPASLIERPTRLARELGARVLLKTNAAGGVSPSLHVGDLMAITRHVWWRDPAGVLASLDEPSPYDAGLLSQLHEVARESGVSLAEGVYAAMLGPTYETPAEVRAVRAMGADSVGMSTAWGARVGASLGMRVAAVSCITNAAASAEGATQDHADVVAVGRSAAERLGRLVAGLASRVGER